MNHEKKRILIVDDNVDIHEDFKKILNPIVRIKNSVMLDLENELFGDRSKSDTTSPVYLIDDAFQGEEALIMVDKAQEDGYPYSLAFMDVRMPPGIDGIETTCRLWQKHPYLEIVICTAYSDYSWEQMLEKLKRNDHMLFIKKPFDGVSVKQIALALTTKWELSYREREHLVHLEAEVERRTEKIRAMMQNLSELKDLAEAATKAKSEFLSNMSHEIRTPINAIVGFGELLKTTALTVEQRDYVETIGSSGEHLLALMNEILDISKIESHKLVLEEIDFDLENLISNVLKMLQMRIFGKPVDLSLVYQSDLPRYFKGDPTRLRQIFFNLIGNSIKFTDNGEVTVFVGVDPNKIITTNEFMTLKCSVKDTGIGIPVDKQNEIFKVFTQVDSSITRKYGGSGLGLNITESLVKMMGGEIKVESIPGKGSEFIFNLCLKPGNYSSDQDKSLVNPESLEHKKSVTVENKEPLVFNNDRKDDGEVITLHTVQEPGDKEISALLVEDNAINQKLMSIMLQQLGCHHEIANNGREAVDILRIRSFDIILMDVQMPVMDGYEATLIIRKELKITTPIIALTAHVFQEEIQKCKDIGMNDYVPKPFEAKKLRETFLRWAKK